MNKYRIGLVSYTNTIPYLWCFIKENKFSKCIIIGNNQLELTLANPAELTKMFEANLLDAALLPVASLLTLQQVVPITNYGIGCNGAVDSVCLFSNNSINNINTVLLDPQSKTSNLLTKILFKNYWKQEVNFEPALEGYQNAIGNYTAAVVIGDRAFTQKPKNTFIYDLGLAWQQYTNLPFLFARWIAKINIAPDLNQMLTHLFTNNFNPVASMALVQNPLFDVATYVTKTIQYNITPNMEIAMQKYLHQGKTL